MTQDEYLAKFREETPALRAWGKFVISIINAMIIDNFGPDSFKRWIKIEPSSRLKTEASLLAKAYITNRGWFNDIYKDITDKVGVRYVVGLSDQIKIIADLLNEAEDWYTHQSKEFDDWKRKDPRIFDYQSAHFVLENVELIVFEGIEIPAGTTCEIQIRSLLQHAYAELSHDTLYKSSITSEPEIHRLFSKSMALMETTDDMMVEAQISTKKSLANLDAIKRTTMSTNSKHLSEVMFPERTREDDFLIDSVRKLLNDDFNENFDAFMKDFSVTLAACIPKNRTNHNLDPLFELGSITIVYFLAKYNLNMLKLIWPFDRLTLTQICFDIGRSPPWERDD